MQVLITPRGVRICAPLVDDSEKSVPLNLHFKEIVKILFHAGKSLPVLFLYVNQSCGAYVRQILHMNDPEGKQRIRV